MGMTLWSYTTLTDSAFRANSAVATPEFCRRVRRTLLFFMIIESYAKQHPVSSAKDPILLAPHAFPQVDRQLSR